MLHACGLIATIRKPKQICGDLADSLRKEGTILSQNLEVTPLALTDLRFHRSTRSFLSWGTQTRRASHYWAIRMKLSNTIVKQVLLVEIESSKREWWV